MYIYITVIAPVSTKVAYFISQTWSPPTTRSCPKPAGPCWAHILSAWKLRLRWLRSFQSFLASIPPLCCSTIESHKQDRYDSESLRASDSDSAKSDEKSRFVRLTANSGVLILCRSQLRASLIPFGNIPVQPALAATVWFAARKMSLLEVVWELGFPPPH